MAVSIATKMQVSTYSKRFIWNEAKVVGNCDKPRKMGAPNRAHRAVFVTNDGKVVG